MFLTGMIIGLMLGTTAGFVLCAMFTLSKACDEEMQDGLEERP